MGNLFMGFPVPRAKIAEMIEGYAPPITHHTRHEATGDDEVPFENLLNRKHAARHESGGDDLVTIPEAGISTIYEDTGFHFKTSFPNLDGFTEATAQLGAVDHYADKVVISTGTTASGYANIVKALEYQLPILTYDRDIFIRVRFAYNIFANVNIGVYIITAGATNVEHLGVRAYTNKLVSDLHDGVGRYHEDIAARAGEGAEFDDIIEIKYYAGVKCEYWLNGALALTCTDHLPTGAFVDTKFLKIATHNTGTENDIYIALSMIEIYQPPAA